MSVQAGVQRPLALRAEVVLPVGLDDGASTQPQMLSAVDSHPADEEYRALAAPLAELAALPELHHEAASSCSSP